MIDPPGEINDPTVIASVPGGDPLEALAAIAAAPTACALVELRADTMRAEAIERVVAGAGRRLIVTVRHRGHGGAFDGAEDERVEILRRALAAGARFVDVEYGTAAAALTAGEPGRTILSDHAAACEAGILVERWRAMAAGPATRIKLCPAAPTASSAAAVRAALDDAGASRRLAAFATGSAGSWTRVLACAWGSWAVYGAATAGAETAAGQLTAVDLLDVYRATSIGEATRRFALIGGDLSRSPSPAMHGAAYRAAGVDAVYVPLVGDDLDDLLSVLDDPRRLGASGFGVTMPFKTALAARCRPGDAIGATAGAVNTIVGPSSDRIGFNTDGPAALGLLQRAVELEGRPVAIAGAGGTARAVGSALRGAGAEVTLYGRDPEAAAEAAGRIGVAWGRFDELPAASWTALVNATPLGGAGERWWTAGGLGGRVVLDAVYRPGGTRLIDDARRRGLVAIDGLDLLAAQAAAQYERLIGQAPPAGAASFRAAAMQWISSRTS